MHHWSKRFFALLAPLLLAGCLWGPGKFTSDLSLRKDGSFILDYRGEILLEVPTDSYKASPWLDSMARCHRSGRVDVAVDAAGMVSSDDPVRPCTKSEIERAKAEHDQSESAAAASKSKDNENMARALGLPGLDDESNRAFATKLMKYSGWRSVVYRGNGVFDVDYHMEGRVTQDFVFPLMPENNLVIPFIAMRRRADGTVLVNAPGLAGGVNMLGPAAQQMGGNATSTSPSRAQGRFTVHTDGKIITNNSEDGPAADPLGQQIRWDIAPGSNKIPETLIHL